MCRVFAVNLQPLALEKVFFQGQGKALKKRTPQEILSFLGEHRLQISRLATDCAKKSTKAGYDAAGLGVGVMDVETLLTVLEQSKAQSPEQLLSVLKKELAQLHLSLGSKEILVSKDGGDFLETHQHLEEGLHLKDSHYIYAWTVHIRQASQGDMYSAVNAHPHQEIQEMQPGNEANDPLFSTMHNGDILDADRFKEILKDHGFQFYSNADSCVIPALQRFLFEALEKDELQKAFQKLSPVLQGQRIAELEELRDKLLNHGAEKTTVVSALCARILELSNLENKFVFQSLSPLGHVPVDCLGGGTLTIVRGGYREGGEEGGEAMFYLPYPEDMPNASKYSAMVGSEENALKDQVKLIDLKNLDVANEVQEAKPLIEELHHLKKQFPQLEAKTMITAGVMPIFDVLPGEVFEVKADGTVSLFNYYSGEKISLKRFHPDWPKPWREKANYESQRQERLAHLKRFRVEYRQENGDLVPPPFNTYGEEIIVVQPKALRDNTQKLFRKNAKGDIEIVPGRKGLGLWMGTDDRADRSNSIRQLTSKLVGAAGTSFLMAQIAEHMCRKLGLNRIPTVVLEGFTGSDTIPPNVSRNTLFVANSNSGGTSDTIKLTRDLTSLPRLCRRLLERYEKSDLTGETQIFIDRLMEVHRKLDAGYPVEELDFEILAHIRDLSPHVFAITNIEASPLGDMGRGFDDRIFRPAGVGVTNLPEEECVGSTFAAMASLQWLIALDTHLGEMRGHISHAYAKTIYQSLAKLPDVCDRIVNDRRLADSICEFSDRCVGGNNDFIYTGYVNGVPEEQAHKFAEMIQTMAVGWHYFMFQHGKYAHVRRASRHALGSIVGHNVPPPSWSFFNSRALKAPREIKARAAIMFAIAHESDREKLLEIPDYSVNYVFTYPEDDLVLYSFQAIMISHLISYYWGLELKKISDQIVDWNRGFLDILREISAGDQSAEISASMREKINEHATRVLFEMSQFYTENHRFDNAEVRRMNAIFRDLYLLASEASPKRNVAVEALLRSPKVSLELKGRLHASRKLAGHECLTVLKDLALELSTSLQAKQIADLFLTDEMGRVQDDVISIREIDGSQRQMKEYDYWCQYEGLAEFYHVNPIHPPKIAKAKKGWL